MALFPAAMMDAWESVNSRLRAAGEVIPRLVMRIVMGWEFFESGLEKYNGENWFADIQGKFPFPFNVVPADLSWTMATWFELIGGIMLWIGLGTRFFAFSLLFLTFVATAAVHWPDMWTMWSDLLNGYAITNKGQGNFKLPLLFVVMLLPLIFNGPGKLSLDHLIARLAGASTQPAPVSDAWTWSLTAAILGLPFLMLIPSVGFVLLGIALTLAAARFLRL
ncbi:DoxX family protein [Tahibacter amnicola]|uniref:DoxX family protein n=1 Tax=Tahibacter amnicola TaxID=2976241 RepID=A0ABY6BBM8_9GAMM|nr:DoxX family protein [Tahibacter amnicola]UXI67274.1 DoxX family protein [Tahibacter amnicola]